MTTDVTQDLFGDLIDAYTRRDAIADGVLVPLSGPDYPATGDAWVPQMVTEAGFLWPLAVTASVFWDCIDVTPAARRAGQDMPGRLWDVLWMLKHAIRSNQHRDNGGAIYFTVFVSVKRTVPTRTTLKCVCGPGDNGEPVMTIMYPHED